MPTRLLLKRWGALCIGMLLMSSLVPSARAGHWWRFTSSSTSSDNCPEGAQSSTTVNSSAGGWVEYPPGYQSVSRSRRLMVPVDRYYCDPRDTRLYSAQGYNVPVTVPLAPVCRTCNYGWGVPSTRLTRAGSYSAWYPDVAFTNRAGRLPGGLYPVVYQPTDTTQAGFYYQYVPTWVIPR